MTDRTFPFLYFARDCEAEREAGFKLAGKLILDVPKDHPRSQQFAEMLDDIIAQIRSHIGESSDYVEIAGWSGGVKPENAVNTDDDELMAAWAKDCLQIAIRVDNGPPGDHLRLDRGLLPGLGGGPWRQ
jgi:hypothetical protein